MRRSTCGCEGAAAPTAPQDRNAAARGMVSARCITSSDRSCGSCKRLESCGACRKAANMGPSYLVALTALLCLLATPALAYDALVLRRCVRSHVALEGSGGAAACLPPHIAATAAAAASRLPAVPLRHAQRLGTQRVLQKRCGGQTLHPGALVRRCRRRRHTDLPSLHAAATPYPACMRLWRHLLQCCCIPGNHSYLIHRRSPQSKRRAAFTVDALAPVDFAGPDPLNCSASAPPFNSSIVPRTARDDLFCYLPNFQAVWGENAGLHAWHLRDVGGACDPAVGTRERWEAHLHGSGMPNAVAIQTASQGRYTQGFAAASARPAGNNELKWGDMWQRHGTCAGFADQSAYFALATAAAKKFDTDVSGPFWGVVSKLHNMFCKFPRSQLVVASQACMWDHGAMQLLPASHLMEGPTSQA